MIIGFIRSIVSQKRIRFVSAPCMKTIKTGKKTREMITGKQGGYYHLRIYEYGDDTEQTRS